jgi:hypothetical protein
MNEASLVDLLQIEKTTHVGTDSTTLSVASSARTQRRLQSVRIQGKVLVIDADRDGRMTLVRADGRGARSFDYLAGHNRFPGLESGLYLTDGVRLLMP